MKLSLAKSGVFWGLWTLVSCSNINTDVPVPHVAKVVDVKSVENYTKVLFETAPRTFNTVENFNALKGKYFGFSTGGSLKIQNIDGSLIVPNGFSGGQTPEIRYLNRNGVALARDYNSFVQMSSFYQFEKIYQNMEKVVGFSAEEFFRQFGFISILFEPKIILKSDTTTTSQVGKLNAAYVTGQKQFVLFKRSGIEEVPLATNPQVLSHEFGHALFEHVFYRNQTQTCKEPSSTDELNARQSNSRFEGRLEAEYVMRGFNEGFADFISFGNVGSTDILRSSIDIGLLADQRNFGVKRFVFQELSVRDKDILKEICGGEFYCIGTLFAKSLLSTMKDLNYSLDSLESRGEFTKKMVNSLFKTKEAMLSLGSDILPLPKDFVAKCEDAERGSDGLYKSTAVWQYHGQMTGAFLHAFVKSTDDSKMKSSLCKYFDEHFGSLGFPESARKICDQN